jgi:hypothetical protein
MPIILGVFFIGGILFLITSAVGGTPKENPELPKGEKEPSFSQEEIRRLRRELRHQTAMKKKTLSTLENTPKK